MSYNPAKGFPRAVCELIYRDTNAAVTWLTSVFGFEELLRWTTAEGRIGHADLALQGGLVMVKEASDEQRSPRELGQATSRLVFFVDDVDRHFRRALAAGAEITTEPRDRPWGLRQYEARDLEGHVWEFSQHVRDIEPADWGAKGRNYP